MKRARRLVCAIFAAGAAFGGAALAEGPPPQRMVTDAEAPAYAAVGRLNVTIGQYCTATLIADRLVLTAAHCVPHAGTGRRVLASGWRVVAGYRSGSAMSTLRRASGPPEIASVREGCTALEEFLGVMRLDCRFVAGGSGSPVFAMGPDGPELVAVLSAAIGPRAEGAGKGLAVEVAPAIAALRGLSGEQEQ